MQQIGMTAKAGIMHQGQTGQRIARRSAWRLVPRWRWATLFAIILTGVIALAACGGDDGRAAQPAEAPAVAVDPPRNSDASPNVPPPTEGDQNGAADPGAPVTLAVGPGLSVPNAINSALDEVLLVNGFLVVVDDVTRLCEAPAESFPPQCSGASLIVAGLDLELVDGLERSGEVQWTSFPFQVIGNVAAGTITVSGTSQG